MLFQDLTQFGLTEAQSQVYIAGLELGPCSILEIAKKTKQNRTTLYHTIQQLIDKKIFATTLHGKKQLYVAEPPAILKQQWHAKLADLDGIVQQLSALSKSNITKPVIKFYDGLDGIRTVFTNAAESKEKTIFAIAGIQRLNSRSHALQDFWLNEFVPLRKKHGISTKLIVPDSPEGLAYAKTDKDSARETRAVPASTYNFECEFMVHDDTVALFVYSDKEQFATSITSPSIANTFKMMWRIIWNQAYIPK